MQALHQISLPRSRGRVGVGTHRAIIDRHASLQPHRRCALCIRGGVHLAAAIAPAQHREA